MTSQPPNPQFQWKAVHEQTAPEPQRRQPKRRWLLVLAVSIVTLGALAGAVAWWLSGSTESSGGKVMACVSDGSREQAGKCPPKGAPHIDGLVQKVGAGDFTLQPMSGPGAGKPRKLYVREPDRPYIDLAHAQTHASLGQPVRVYTKNVDGREVVIYMEDAPLLGN